MATFIKAISFGEPTPPPTFEDHNEFAHHTAVADLKEYRKEKKLSKKRKVRSTRRVIFWNLAKMA